MVSQGLGFEFQLPGRMKTLGGPGTHLLKYHMCGGEERTGRSHSADSKDQNGARIFIAYGEVIFKWVCKQGSPFDGWPPSLGQPLTQGGLLTLWSQGLGLAWTPLLLGQGIAPSGNCNSLRTPVSRDQVDSTAPLRPGTGFISKQTSLKNKN